MELPELKRALAERAEEVCRHLLPHGKSTRDEWECGDLAGAAGKSLKVHLTGQKAGVWRDFAGDIGGSNLLELWIQARSVPFKAALDEAREWLGARGVRAAEDGRPLRRKTYAKPVLAGIVQRASRVEEYLIHERQLPKSTLDLYQVAALTGGDAIVFPYLAAEPPHATMMWKAVKLDRDERGKKISWTSRDTPKALFGQHTRRPGDRHLLICEGEIDAMTWRTMLHDQPVCCTSVPFGAKWAGKDGRDPNDEWLTHDWDFISTFERIYLSMDMDGEGRRAQAALVKRLGRELCFCIELPEKDANALLQAGREDELVTAYVNARTLDPEVLKNIGAYKQAILDRLYSPDPLKRGIPLPFGPHPFHIRWNEWTVVTGMNGSGKTTLLNFILLHLSKLDYGCVVASLEVPSVQTGVFFVPQATGEKLPRRETAEQALDWMAGFIWFYDVVGSTELADVLAAWRYAYRRYGCRIFVLDSWMKLKGIKPDDLEQQGDACRRLSEFVRDNDVHVFIVAHPRKLKSEHEKVGKLDVKGSGQLTDEAHNVWAVSRNKAKEREIEKMLKFNHEGRDLDIALKRRGKPDAWLSIEKQRNDEGDEPLIDLWYVKPCKQYFGHYRTDGISLLTDSIPQPPATVSPAERSAASRED